MAVRVGVRVVWLLRVRPRDQAACSGVALNEYRGSWQCTQHQAACLLGWILCAAYHRSRTQGWMPISPPPVLCSVARGDSSWWPAGYKRVKWAGGWKQASA